MSDIDHKFAGPFYVKQAASLDKRVFERGFEISTKNNNTNRVYEHPPLKWYIQDMLNKDLFF